MIKCASQISNNGKPCRKWSRNLSGWLRPELWIRFPPSHFVTFSGCAKLFNLTQTLKRFCDVSTFYKIYRQKKKIVSAKRPTILWYYFKDILPVTQKSEAVRAGNYRDCFVNQAHPWLLLVNSHTHPWNSWKRTLLVWLCWSAYCNYVAFNCALLTPSDRGWAATRDWDESLVCGFEAGRNSLFCYKDPFFHHSAWPWSQREK